MTFNYGEFTILEEDDTKEFEEDLEYRDEVKLPNGAIYLGQWIKDSNIR